MPLPKGIGGPGDRRNDDIVLCLFMMVFGGLYTISLVIYMWLHGAF